MAGPVARLTAADLKLLLRIPFDGRHWIDVVDHHFHVRIGNAPPTLDRESSLAQIKSLLARLTRIGCDFCELWQRREAIYAETDLCYLDEHGLERSIPCVIIARVAGGRLIELRFHFDPAPLG